MSIVEIAEQSVPFALDMNAKFRSTDIRTGVLISGSSGWGEFAPFPEYYDKISARWLAGALEAAFGKFPDRIRTAIPVNAIIPMLSELETKEAVSTAITKHGMTTIKLKVADGTPESLANDLARIAATQSVFNELGIEGKIRIDVNGAWTAEQAIVALQRITEVVGSLDYAEQPCRELSELRILKTAMQNWSEPVPIAIDESIRMSDQIDLASIREIADVAVVKAIPLGGVQRALDIVMEIGLPTVVSGSLDTSVGLSSAIALAASIPQLYGACGLGTGTLFAQDLVTETTLPENGELQVRRSSPDAHLLSTSANRVSNADRLWWQQRIVRAWQAGASDLVSAQVREAVGA
ncbi:MAG: o-succinylbenzoate synthase [Actinobacteria bacterium]|uniref:Unannotated protein n=1 Tax=freshwater metagenome TaxID=449393 RepID=A0A6J6T529_9ZZZZ|nr:o-succinylbenzoate synthase [Actinomycetota bacterium]